MFHWTEVVPKNHESQVHPGVHATTWSRDETRSRRHTGPDTRGHAHTRQYRRRAHTSDTRHTRARHTVVKPVQCGDMGPGATTCSAVPYRQHRPNTLDCPNTTRGDRSPSHRPRGSVPHLASCA
eukprot:2886437-Prymnesium_polylepis.1